MYFHCLDIMYKVHINDVQIKILHMNINIYLNNVNIFHILHSIFQTLLFKSSS